MNGEKSLEGKAIIVFGATSKIGSVTAKTALRRGARTIGFVRDEAKAKDLKQAGVEIVVGDIVRYEDVVGALINENKVDATINFASVLTNQSADPEKSIQVNVNGERNVIRATEEFRIQRHIFISTIGTWMEGPNAYRDTKLKAEELVRLSKLSEWMILRYGNILGTSDPNDLWNRPFMTPSFARQIGVAKIPGDKGRPFPYLGIKTAVEATINALDARPNQTITILDGFTTLDQYLDASARRNGIDHWTALSGHCMVSALKAVNSIATLMGKNFPLTPGAMKMLAQMPDFELETMVRELNIIPQSFEEVMQS